MSELKPLLKWAGGKSWLISKMRELYAPYRDRVWVDPFCGSLALPLALRPDRAFLSDINPYLIELYQQIKFSDFKPQEIENTEKEYYETREVFNRLIETNSPDRKTLAQLFYYLNHAGYNGLCRFNQKGEFNVPYGKRKKLSFVSDFTPYREAFFDWWFECSTYRPIVCRKKDSFLYLDPPYDAGFTAYSGNEFGWAQQVELIEWANQWDCPIVISNLATDRIIELYEKAGFEIEIVEAPRSISCNGDRKKVLEVLAKRGFSDVA